MSRVLLVSTNTLAHPFPVYPLGMSQVAGALVRRGHEVCQFDFLVEGADEERLAAAVRAFAPDVVGFSLRNLDECDATNPDVSFPDRDRRLVERVRRETSVPVILGGPAFSIAPEAYLQLTGANAGVAGEGERAVCRMVEDLVAGRPVPPVLRADGPPLENGDLTPPLIDPAIAAFYRDETGMGNLQTKRGCPYSCAYCTYPSLEGHRFRARPVEAVADDLERLKTDHGMRMVFFTDSIFNDPEGHHLLLAEELARRDLGVKWCAFFRPQGLDRPSLALMRRAGLQAVELGTDAASDTTLAALDKGFTVADVLEANAACAAEQIPAANYVMFGCPGETRATIDEGLDTISRLEYAVVFAFTGVRVYPGTPLHRTALAEGLVDPADPLLLPFYYHAPGTSSAMLADIIGPAFHGQRDRIFPPADAQRRMAVMQRFGYRGVLWDRLVSFHKPPPARRPASCP